MTALLDFVDLDNATENAPLVDSPVCEFRNCPDLGQADVDHLLGAGVPAAALAHGPRRLGREVRRDVVVLDPGGRSFEFARHRLKDEGGVSAYVILVFDAYGEPLDLAAFRIGAVPFVASWLGRAALLGEHQVRWTWDALRVHASALDWLRAAREGVVVIDPVHAAPLLRDAGRLEVADQGERRRILDLMTVRLPPVTVRAPRGSVA